MLNNAASPDFRADAAAADDPGMGGRGTVLTFDDSRMEIAMCHSPLNPENIRTAPQRGRLTRILQTFNDSEMEITLRHRTSAASLRDRIQWLIMAP